MRGYGWAAGLGRSVLVTLVMAGCGSSSEDSKPATTTVSSAATSTAEGGAEGSVGSTSTSGGASTTETTGPSTSDPYRVAPVGETLVVLRWDSEGIWLPNHAGEWRKVADGPFVEVAEVPYGGVVFQRQEREPVIWLTTESGPRELVVAGQNQSLTLEGVGLGTGDQPIVYYQRHESGSPATTRSSLRTYNLETGAVTEIIETGGWESGTHFDHLGLELAAIGNWSAESISGNTMIDLSLSSQRIWDLADEGCEDGEEGCIAYDHTTMVGGRAVGVRSIREPSGTVDQFGIFEFDAVTGTERLIAAFPWDNGLWYVEDLFGYGNGVVLSLSDSPALGGNPLPALVVDVDSGEAFTMPDPAFVRPAYLS